jgi:hypothetical protein
MIQRDSNIYWQIPSGLNLPTKLTINPPAFKRKVKIDMFYSILDQITKGVWLTNIEDNRGIIEIHSTKLQAFNHEYKEYVEYLLENNIVATDNHYIIG